MTSLNLRASALIRLWKNLVTIPSVEETQFVVALLIATSVRKPHVTLKGVGAVLEGVWDPKRAVTSVVFTFVGIAFRLHKNSNDHIFVNKCVVKRLRNRIILTLQCPFSLKTRQD